MELLDNQKEIEYPVSCECGLKPKNVKLVAMSQHKCKGGMVD